MDIALRNKLEALAGLPLTQPTDSLNFKPPQARIPVRVKFVRRTTGGQGIAVQLDGGKWLSCFDNRKMGEDGETQLSILEGATGKTCIFLTTQSKDQKYTNITHVLQCGDREWDETGIPILRREPATKPMREPGDDTEEQWLK